MTKCKEYDSCSGKCKSGWIPKRVFCSGRNSTIIPYCMMEDPPKQLIRQDGLPIGWHDHDKD